MDTSVYRNFKDLTTREIAPGFFSKLIHTANNTINFIDVKAGCTVGLHQHIHEQCSFVLEGQFELTIDGVSQVLDPGTYAVIPSNAMHTGTAVTDCRLIDLFSPVREDYR